MAIRDKIRKILDKYLPADTRNSTEIESRQRPADHNPMRNDTVGDFYYNFVDKIETDRISRYRDYNMMDEERTEISRALDDHADLQTTSADTDVEPILIKSDIKKVETVLNELMDRTHFTARLWSIAREMVKYGDDFEEIIVDENNLVVRIKGLPVEQMVRREDDFGRLEKDAYIQMGDNGTAAARFEEWQIVHFRNDRPRSSKYGRSILWSSRRTWRQLQLIEDGMVVTRLARAPQRYAYMIPGGDMSTTGQEDLIGAYKRIYTKRPVRDAITGKLSLESSALTPNEDIFIPTSKDYPADVKVLAGQGSLGDIKDVEYLQNELLTKLEIPKSLMGLQHDTGSSLGTSGTDAQERHFIRKVNRRRMQLAAGIRQICDLQLKLLGYDLKAATYTVEFPSLMADDAEAAATTKKAEVDTVKIGTEIGLSVEYAMKNFTHLDAEEMKELEKDLEAERARREKEQDKTMQKQTQMAVTTASAKAGAKPEVPKDLGTEVLTDHVDEEEEEELPLLIHAGTLERLEELVGRNGYHN